MPTDYDPGAAVWVTRDRAEAAEAEVARIKAAIKAVKADLTALAHWSPEDWAERGRGADSIARTINAARDIVDRHLGGHDAG